MGCEPLENDRSLHLLKDWMHRDGHFTLWDISIWDKGDWHSWISLVVPPNLSSDLASFLDFLNGKAPLHCRKVDVRG